MNIKLCKVNESIAKRKRDSIQWSSTALGTAVLVPSIPAPRQSRGETCAAGTFYFLCGMRGPVSELTCPCPGSIIPELCDLGPVPRPLCACMTSAVPQRTPLAPVKVMLSPWVGLEGEESEGSMVGGEEEQLGRAFSRQGVLFSPQGQWEPRMVCECSFLFSDPQKSSGSLRMKGPGSGWLWTRGQVELHGWGRGGGSGQWGTHGGRGDRRSWSQQALSRSWVHGLAGSA